MRSYFSNERRRLRFVPSEAVGGEQKEIGHTERSADGAKNQTSQRIDGPNAASPLGCLSVDCFATVALVSCDICRTTLFLRSHGALMFYFSSSQSTLRHSAFLSAALVEICNCQSSPVALLFFVNA
jgi:hypothetical protein